MPILLAILSVSLAAAQPAADFYVAANGRDTWSGRLPEPNAAQTDGPFATPQAARDAVRRASQNSDQPRSDTVLIRGGTYELAETLRFTPADARTTYAAYSGEHPILSGGRRVRGWTQRGDRWTTTVPEVAAGKWYGRQLFANGVRQTRARTPNTGFLRSDGPPRFTPDDLAALQQDFGERLSFKSPATSGKFGFRYKPGEIQRWTNLDDAVLHVYHAWTSAVHWIAELNEANRTVRFTGPSRFPSSHFEAQQPYYVENVKEALDTPGEWYLDRQTGVLTWLAPNGVDPNREEVVLSRLQTLVSLDGDAKQQQFVDGLVFRGLSLRYADWGPLDRQAENDGLGSVHFLVGAVMATGATRCAFDQCAITRCGGYGIYLIDGSAECRVTQCELSDLGGGGILVGSRWSPYDTFHPPLPPDDAPESELTRRNVIDNCYLHGCGRIFRGVVGIFIAHSPFNRVSHNELCDLSYSGMVIGRRLDRKYSHAHHNEVAYNHIHHLGDGTMSDMGGIYTEGISPGTRLHHNLIHDVRRYRYGGWGLYCDQSSTGIRLDHNVVHDCEDGGFMQNVGGPNVLENNLLAFHVDRGMINSGRAGSKTAVDSLTIERNIIVTNLGQVLGYYVEPQDDYRFDHNLYWKPAELPLQFDKRSWDEWQATGQDAHSLVADPLFVDPEHGDFRLRPGSPAEKLGFEPIEVSEIGLYGDPEWVAKPRQQSFQPFVPLDPPPPLPVDEEFESLQVGDPVPGTTVFGETANSSIRVTDETAATGRHSLKFIDSAGLPKPHWPYCAFRPKRETGPATLTFAVKVGQDALVWHEWRDAADPYRVGPTLQLRDGGLVVKGRKLCDVPLNQWCKLTITCALGNAADGLWTLQLDLPRQPPQRFGDLPCGAGPEFRELRWLGFISLGEEDAVWYLDDVRLADE